MTTSYVVIPARARTHARKVTQSALQYCTYRFASRKVAWYCKKKSRQLEGRGRSQTRPPPSEERTTHGCPTVQAWRSSPHLQVFLSPQGFGEGQANAAHIIASLPPATNRCKGPSRPPSCPPDNDDGPERNRRNRRPGNRRTPVRLKPPPP